MQQDTATMSIAGWTPLRLNPYFAMLPGVGSFRAYTAAGVIAGDGDAVQQIVANTGQVLNAPSAAMRGVWRVAANGRPYLDMTSNKGYVQDGNFGLTGSPSMTIAANVRFTFNPTIGSDYCPLFSLGPYTADGDSLTYCVRNNGNRCVRFADFDSTKITNYGTNNINIFASHTLTRAGGTSIFDLAINGVADPRVSGATAVTQSLADAPFSLSYLTTPTVRYGLVYVSDLLIFTPQLSSGDLSRVTSWLMARRIA